MDNKINKELKELKEKKKTTKTAKRGPLKARKRIKRRKKRPKSPWRMARGKKRSRKQLGKQRPPKEPRRPRTKQLQARGTRRPAMVLQKRPRKQVPPQKGPRNRARLPRKWSRLWRPLHLSSSLFPSRCRARSSWTPVESFWSLNSFKMRLFHSPTCQSMPPALETSGKTSHAFQWKHWWWRS